MFVKNEIKILGNVVCDKKIKQNPDKIKSIRGCSTPTTINELMFFFGINKLLERIL